MKAPDVRRAEFMLVLAYASDLATGQTRDFALRACVLAMRLARAARLDESQHRAIFHQALLRYIGCNADSHLLTATFGDEFVLRRDVAQTNLGDMAERKALFTRALTRANASLPPDELSRVLAESLPLAPQITVPILSGHCEVAQRIGARLGLSEDMLTNLGQLYERWDGRGLPNGITGEAVKLAVRVVTLAQDAVTQADEHGIDGMARIIAARRDGPYEAALADVLLADPHQFLADIDDETGLDAILSLEPQPHAMMDETACDEAFLAIADMVDMRMPHTIGHSRAVAALAEAAGRHMKLPAQDLRTLRWAACVHDVGELAVPVATWLKPQPFSRRESDEMQLHPYHGERALAAMKGACAAVSGLVLRHHERLDGSGYHRKVTGADLSPAARLLAAAEAYQSAREPRPHRAARSDAAAAGQLREAVRQGRLCGEATAAVLASAGQGARRDQTARLAGLSPREIETLRLIIAGHTAKEAARLLDIAPKTAENHIQNLYAKIGVKTRAGAALYAVEHGLATG